MLYASCPVGWRADYVDQRRLAPIGADWRQRADADWRRPAPTVADQIGADRRRHRLATTLDYNARAKRASNTPPTHPVPLYIFKAPNGVGVPAPHACAGLRFQRRTGGLQRPTPVQV